MTRNQDLHDAASLVRETMARLTIEVIAGGVDAQDHFDHFEQAVESYKLRIRERELF